MSIRISDIMRWKISGAQLMPNGRRLKQNRPKGVMKVVSSLESGLSGTCQNQLLQSSLVKILLCPNFARLSSTEDIGNTSLCTALFNCVRSTHIRAAPLGFGTTTMPEHRLVGSCTGEIMSSLIMFSSSALTFDRRG